MPSPPDEMPEFFEFRVRIKPKPGWPWGKETWAEVGERLRYTVSDELMWWKAEVELVEARMD